MPQAGKIPVSVSPSAQCRNRQ